ncbi:MAG: DUF2127 domain-containing protein, partial [Verrucomicrobiaceae bacterium]
MHSERRIIRMIAATEALKGSVVMLAGISAFALVHRDIQALAELLVRHSHLNPSSHYPRIFVEAASKVHDPELRLLAAGAAVYALARFIEAYGLWYQRGWAEWFAAVSGGIYLPIEMYELFRGITGLKLMVLLLNVAVVSYMIRVLWKRKRTA